MLGIAEKVLVRFKRSFVWMLIYWTLQTLTDQLPTLSQYKSNMAPLSAWIMHHLWSMREWPIQCPNIIHRGLSDDSLRIHRAFSDDSLWTLISTWMRMHQGYFLNDKINKSDIDAAWITSQSNTIASCIVGWMIMPVEQRLDYKT